MSSKPKVLFLCTGNSCRSQMAEAWARHYHGQDLDVYSAGTETHGMNERAIKVMQEAGVEMHGHFSKRVDSLSSLTFDLIVTVCADADQNCPVILKSARIVHVGFDDPPRLAQDSSDEAATLRHYRRVRDEIRDFTRTRLPELLASAQRAPSVDR